MENVPPDAFRKVSFTVYFDSQDDMQTFIKVLKKQQRPKKTDDQRGAKTHLLHAEAKKIKQAHPELAYRDCLKRAGEVLRHAAVA